MKKARVDRDRRRVVTIEERSLGSEMKNRYV
jgi:hypothetical protein